MYTVKCKNAAGSDVPAAFCVTVQPCAGLNEKVCCKLACISTFSSKSAYGGTTKLLVFMNMKTRRCNGWTVTGFCRCFAFRIGKIHYHHCIVRNFQFRKFLPVYSNTVVPIPRGYAVTLIGFVSFADQNHAPSLSDVRLELQGGTLYTFFLSSAACTIFI